MGERYIFKEKGTKKQIQKIVMTKRKSNSDKNILQNLFFVQEQKEELMIKLEEKVGKDLMNIQTIQMI